MFLTRISVNHPVFATMIMVAIMVFGIYSYQRLPVEQLPDIDLPVVAVVVSYPGASPEAVEADVIEPIEDAVNTIAGLDTIQSVAQSGQAMIIMIFDLEANSQQKAQDVRDKIDPVKARLPAGANDPQVLRFDPAALPLLSLAVSSNTLSDRDLTALTKDVIAKRLSNIDGVGSASVVGGVPRQLNINIDPDRLSAFNISPGAVVSALQAANKDLAAGAITQDSIVRSIQVLGRLEDEQDFYNITVGNQGGQAVTLRDVATIEDGTGEATSLAILNGERALAIDILKTQGANTVGVAAEIRRTIERLEATELPKDAVKIQVVVDNAKPVEDSFHAVQNMLVEGAALAVVIVFVFLNSWRSTIITGLTLPISIIGTMVALHVMGFSLNTMTLLALSLAVGILIDDAIVVRENITRHLHMGKTHRQAALDGTNEIGLAVMATTLSIVAVFLPVAFMDGIMGRFFLQFGVTVSVAVLISLFVAFTLDPMMSSVWYDPAANPNAKRGPIGKAVQQFDRLFEWITEGYRHLIRWGLKFRKTVLLIALLSLVGSVLLFPRVGVEFMPATDTGIFTIKVETPAGSAKEYTASKLRQAEAVVRSFPDIETTYSTISGSLAASGSNSGTLTVTMVDKTERSSTPSELMPRVRRALEAVPGAEFEVSVASNLGAGTAPVSVTLYGDSIVVLERLSEQLMADMRRIDGLIDVSSSLDDAEPVVGIRVNRELADSLGVSMGQIAATLGPLISGENVADWTAKNGQVYSVVVRLPQDLRNDVDAIGNLPIAQSGATGSAGMITLGQVAEVVESTGPSTINRQDLQRGVTISANVEGVELGAVAPQLQAALARIDFPAGYRSSFGGEVEQIADTMGTVGSALLLAVIFIYLVLASQFGSFLQPLAIMGSLPLAIIGVMVGLLIGGSTLNMFSAIGFIMLMGLVVKNAILLVDNANQHVREGWNLYDALVEAGVTRFRPIIMTTLAMIFGMLPLALNLHEGSGQNAPMAHAVIGGLISSTALTLLVVPVLLTYIDRFSVFMRRIMPKAPDDMEHAAPVEADSQT
ncbi:efflux RND transporter permease subunit [Devosia sp. 63-57]|uniref:efflux RND transporter permease subunit n=1 Tax=Devosia sp. 63-57 TaxID=1895751 RepID=UPI00086A8A06|nr:efflux RND transporter permease subunit [Devosia sp. 63-57]ODT51316.1 MAG: nodulation protein NolG [Pelagibacterium sp. SCN 63-126]ODU86606.1 MAG: nodulation protein NolG [Pelagibacterium sp. SCN 63-17]OJX41780.1 MAG: nodulation protein NolG [Devosia sp. 63-57]